MLGTSFDEGGSRCEWGSKLLLVIYTGYGPTIVPGHNITFLKNEDCYLGSICTEYNTYPMRVQQFAIAASSDPVQVQAYLIGPAAIGLCQDAKIQLTAAGGAGRDLVIEWGIPDELLYSKSCNLTDNLDFLFIEANCTGGAGLDDGYLNFSVTVTS